MEGSDGWHRLLDGLVSWCWGDAKPLRQQHSCVGRLVHSGPYPYFVGVLYAMQPLVVCDCKPVFGWRSTQCVRTVWMKQDCHHLARRFVASDLHCHFDVSCQAICYAAHGPLLSLPGRSETSRVGWSVRRHQPARTLGRPQPDPDPGSCRLFPYGVVPDQSSFCDRQSWKVQEPPETVPTGELPRSVLVVVERSMVDKAPPGTRVSILCVPTLFHHSSSDSVQSVYLRVVGLRKATHGSTATFAPEEESAFRQLSQHPDVYRILSRSMAPSISGNYTVDIEKAILCMLLGGSRKRLPDGIALRGDINVLLLGDPSTAKSQFLKFASRAAPHWGLHFREGFVGGRPDGIRRQGQAR